MSKVPSQREAVDLVLLQKIGDRVHTIFIQCKQRPPARAEIVEAGKIYNELLKTVPDIADEPMVEAVLPVLSIASRSESKPPSLAPANARTQDRKSTYLRHYLFSARVFWQCCVVLD